MEIVKLKQIAYRHQYKYNTRTLYIQLFFKSSLLYTSFVSSGGELQVETAKY